MGVLRSFAENSLLYSGVLSFLGIAVGIGGVSIFLLESPANQQVTSLADGLWWALVTITTVGYGDVTPVTAGGRFIAGILMVAGMFTLALFAGLVSTTILNVMFRLREEQFRMSTHVNHMIICGYDAGARMLLDALLEELGDDAPELIIFAPQERPLDVPPEFTWVAGDPTKESELDKVRLAQARAVLIVGPRDKTLQEADATTILTVFTIRSYLAKDAETAHRKVPLYIVAEILSTENVDHARAAGADEVIETTRLGFNLMAHSTQAQGSGEVLAEVASTGTHSVFLGRFPFSEPRTFAVVCSEVLNRYGVTVLGVRDAGGTLELSPKAERMVQREDGIVYIAKKPVLDAFVPQVGSA